MKLCVFPTAAEASQRAAERIAARLRDATRRRGEASVALSGGGSAPTLIAALVADAVPWEVVTVYQVDERIAPDGHAARNAGQLAELGSLTRVEPMPVGDPTPEHAAERYAARLPDRLDVVHLGIGSDGHTASWPPGVDAVRDAHRAVVPTPVFNGWERLTLTRRMINGARCRVVLATGASKQHAVAGWFAGDAELPVAAVRRTDTWVYLDRSAVPADPD